ncbi:hypothetical protein ACFQ3K_15310 [Brucella gallinifaecis]|nr:hypothetical protein [Brucella gallinifaecis]
MKSVAGIMLSTGMKVDWNQPLSARINLYTGENDSCAIAEKTNGRQAK